MRRCFLAAAALCAVLSALVLAVPGLRFSALLLLCLAALSVVAALLGRRARRALAALLCVGLVCFLGLEALVVSGAKGTQAEDDVSWVLVLGAGVHGTQPSLMLRVRLDAALAFLADRPGIPVVVSGCQGRGEDISEAECMFRYLTAHGIDAARVWKEERATSTRTNFTYAAELVAARDLDPTAAFAYVTNDFHVYRAGVIAGVPQAYGVAAKLPRTAYYDALEFNYFIREAFALANELLFRMDLDL
ncbi:MAG: YdcF family protein [Oscillospiraceae bacterium]|nr:YdcF family protein [Oscillospiraceae bacterium]